MKARYLGAAVALALAASAGAASAATIENVSGQSCGTFTGLWHFVNNQTNGAAAGSLTANWSSGDTCSVGAASVNKNSQHFFCSASGTLIDASTNLPGRLVLSDFSCDDKKVEEPPM